MTLHRVRPQDQIARNQSGGYANPVICDQELMLCPRYSPVDKDLTSESSYIFLLLWSRIPVSYRSPLRILPKGRIPLPSTLSLTYEERVVNPPVC